MNDLSHWDFAADFSPGEVVALTLGLDMNRLITAPNQDDLKLELARFLPALERMRQCYEGARAFFQQCMSPPEHPTSEPPDMLCSVEMCRHLAEHDPCDGSRCQFYVWVIDNELSGFNTQRFARKAVVDWLTAIGQVSIYAFDGAKATTPVNAQPKQTARWLWGAHHTQLLGHLEAAAIRFWGADYYDPTDKGTAPQNKVIESWLATERKLESGAMRKAIATILRLDGLPTGPRSK